MFKKREIIGNFVTFIFYFGIMSTVISFATGIPAGETGNTSIKHSANTNTVSFAVSNDNPYGYEQ